MNVIKCNCNRDDCPIRLWPLEEGLKIWREGEAINTEHYIWFSIEDNLKLRKYLRRLIEEELDGS